MSDKYLGSEVIRLKSMPKNWLIKNFIDVATLQRGKDLPLDLRSPGSYPVIGSNGVAGYHSEFVSKGPGVLVGRSGSAGKVTFIETNFWPLNTTLWVKDFHENDPAFIYYFLSHFDFGRYTAGVSVPTLNRNLVHPIKVRIPPLPEQRAIARALRAVQGAREARLREVALERERKAALMERLFTHGTRGEATKTTEIGEMPESWSVVKIGDISSALGSGVTPRGGEKSYLSDGIPLIRSQNVLMNKISLDDVAFISLDVHRSMNRSEVKPGDLLLNITGASIGRVAYVPKSIEVANVNQHVCRIRFADSISSGYVSYFLSYPKGQSQIMGSQFGTTRQGLNYGNVRAIKLPLPTILEQNEIAGILQACDSKIAALENEARLHQELFRAMLEELMSGRLKAGELAAAESGG
jgi:type I restriction enzyme, S subunit